MDKKLRLAEGHRGTAGMTAAEVLNWYSKNTIKKMKAKRVEEFKNYKESE